MRPTMKVICALFALVNGLDKKNEAPFTASDCSVGDSYAYTGAEEKCTPTIERYPDSFVSTTCSGATPICAMLQENKRRKIDRPGEYCEMECGKFDLGSKACTEWKFTLHPSSIGDYCCNSCIACLQVTKTASCKSAEDAKAACTEWKKKVRTSDSTEYTYECDVPAPPTKAPTAKPTKTPTTCESQESYEACWFRDGEKRELSELGCEWTHDEERYAKANGEMGTIDRNSESLRGKDVKWHLHKNEIATVEAIPSSTKYQPLYMCSKMNSHWFKYSNEACSPSDDTRCLRSDYVSVDNGPGQQIRESVHSWDQNSPKSAYIHTLFCGKLLRESSCKTKQPPGGGCFHKDTEFRKRTGQTAASTAVSALQKGDQILMYDMDNSTTKYATILGFAVKPSGACHNETHLRMFPFINITYQINDYQFSGEIIDSVGELTADSNPPARHVTTMSGSSSFSVTPAHKLAIVRNESVLHIKAQDVVLGDMLAIWDGTDVVSASITSFSLRDANETAGDQISAYLPITDKGLHVVLADGAVVPIDAEIVVDGIKINDIYVRSLISASGQIYANIPAALRESLVAPLMTLEDSELYGPCVQTAAFTNIWLRLLRRDNGKILKLVEAAYNYEVVLDLVKDELISAFFPSWHLPPSFVKTTINSAIVLGMHFDGAVRYFDLFRDSFNQNEPENKTHYAPTPLPSKSPTTADPTTAPVAAAGGSTTIIIVVIVIVIIVVLFVFVCWRKKKEGSTTVVPESKLVTTLPKRVRAGEGE